MNDPDRPSLPAGLLRELLRRLRLSRPRPPRDVPAERLRAQVRVIRDAMRGPGVLGAPAKGSQPPRDDADVDYLYRPRHALVRREDLGRLEEYFATDENRKRFTGELAARETRVLDLVLAALPSRVDGRDDVLATLEELERSRVVERGTVTPDHVVYVTPRGFMCPATEPETPHRHTQPWPAAQTSPGRLAGRDRVRVAVVDTGLWTDAVGSARTPWLAVGDVVADPSDVETVNPAAIHPYAGHGTFVAGVISCLAPDTRIEVEGVLVHGGAVFESEIVQQLHEAIEDDDRPQVISISAGTHTRGDFALLGFELLGRSHELRERDDVLIVAAAGNDSSDRPFWPAAFPWVVSVGSVDPDASVSDFSNVGPWVDVYARGRDLVNAFPKGSYTCHEPPHVGEVRTFDGLAQWSGTSFATPVVTGLIAARMRETGQSARAAWQDVAATATPRTDPRGGAIQVVGPLT
ncbi:S8 family peptidase [Nocardioides nitrophenolicus]|uniref:S8 family peptidase n=1 Tax=Nocardioides nitrophenolicus TaxID=60489 RepID=UPI00195CC673|nr:S8/S53 family peptidase [Nocardioides nitrophenolicus]MBM7517307.1 subtilisin family serine protease [Nocardioides nitrophenolicus]